MAKNRLALVLFVALCICALSANSFAKPAAVKCGFNGDYSFFFFAPSDEVAGVGFYSSAQPSDRLSFGRRSTRRNNQLQC